MTGSIVFLADLIRKLDMPLRVGVVQTSSYRGTARGPLSINADMMPDIAGRDVLIFEDVVDTGLTLRKLLGLLGTRMPRSLKIAALLKKDLAENADLPVDFLGFTIGPEFVVGYGLDLDEKYRNLPYVAIWDPSR